MADKKPPEGLKDSSTSESKSRAKRINSMQDQLYRLDEQNMSQKQRIKDSMEETQRSTDYLSKTSDTDEIESAIPEINKTISSLNYVISSLGKGIKNITEKTAQTTSEAISQYGRAISEDISINKEHAVAMSLAKATPLFGYFAAKFVETDVFKSATENMKKNIKKGLGGVWSGIKALTRNIGEDVGGLFTRKGKVKYSQESKAAMGEVVASLKEIKEKTAKPKARDIKEKIPKLQKGGYVEKGGLAQVHPAEVVMPIDKILARIDETIPDKKKLSESITKISQSYGNLETFIAGKPTEKRSLIGTFMHAFAEAKNSQDKKWQDRMLKAILDLRVGLIGSQNRLQLAWQKTLIEHPTFRNLIMFGDLLKTAFVSPLKYLFGIQGTYKGHIARATRTKNVFEKISNVLGILYSGTMTRLDNLVSLQRELVELAGGKGEKIKEKKWTRMGKLKEWVAKPKDKRPILEKAFDYMVKKFNLDRDELERAGITSIGDLKNIRRWADPRPKASAEPLESFAKAKRRPYKITQPGAIKVHAGEMVSELGEKYRATRSVVAESIATIIQQLNKGKIKRFVDREEKKEMKWREKWKLRQEKFTKTLDNVFDKHIEKSKKRRIKFEEKSEKIIEKRNEKIKNRETSMIDYKAKLEKRTANNLAAMRDRLTITTEIKRSKIISQGMNAEEKVRSKYRKKSIWFQRRMMFLHKSLLFFTEFRAQRQRKKELKHQKKISSMLDKLRKKEEKILDKTARIREKMEKRKLKITQKLELIKEKVEMKARVRSAKIEAKKLAMERKLEMIREGPKMKADRILAKQKMKKEMINMKEQMKIAKAETRERSKEMKEKIKEAKAEQRKERIKMISDKWKEAKSLPEKIEEFRKQAATQHGEAMGVFQGIGFKLKKLGGSIWGIMLAILSTITSLATGLFS